MVSNNKIIHLRADGTFYESKAKVKKDFPNHWFTKSGFANQAFHLVSDPVFIVDKAIKYVSWDDWLRSPTPDFSIKSKKRAMVVPANSEFPIGVDGPLEWSAKKAFGVAQDEEIIQSAAIKATREDAGVDTTRKAMMLMAGAVVVLALLLAWPLFNTIGWFKTPPPEPQPTRVQQPSEQVTELSPGVCVAWLPAINDYISVECQP